MNKSLIDKQLENSLSKVFSNLDVDRRNALTYKQFERFLYMNCFDFILDFYEPDYIKRHLFSKEALDSADPRCTFSDILRFIEEQSCYKHSKQEYKEALSFFTRGYDPKKGSGPQNQPRSNIEDVCAAMHKFTDMTETEIRGYENAHDMQLLIDEVR